MKTFNQIVEDNTNEEDGIPDLAAIITEATTLLGKPPAMSPAEVMALQEQHMAYGLKYLAGVVLHIGVEVGALPEGFDVEYENVELMLDFDKLRRIYAVKQHREGRQVEGQLQIVEDEA